MNENNAHESLSEVLQGCSGEKKSFRLSTLIHMCCVGLCLATPFTIGDFCLVAAWRLFVFLKLLSYVPGIDSVVSGRDEECARCKAVCVCVCVCGGRGRVVAAAPQVSIKSCWFLFHLIIHLYVYSLVYLSISIFV